MQIDITPAMLTKIRALEAELLRQSQERTNAAAPTTQEGGTT